MSVLEIVLIVTAGLTLAIWATILIVKAKKNKNKKQEEEGEKYE